MKINIIGPFPPPYGGISVHVKRMMLYLINNNVEVTIYNEAKNYSENSKNIRTIGSYKNFIFKIPFLKGDTIHFHTISKKIRILMGLFKIFNKKIVLTIHGESLHDQLEESNWISKKLLLFSMNKIDKIVCVNSNTINELICLGISNEKLSYIPAFINPIENEQDFKNINQNVWNFINNSDFLISSNGWVRFYNKQDLYGIDMLIELIRKLKDAGYNISLLIALLGTNMENDSEKLYYEDLKNKIKEYNLQSNIMVFEVKDTEFYPILKKSKLFLRPTNTDGDAVSIREALYYKVPTIASDVVKRPEGTIIFRTRDIEDLYIKTIDVIENYNLYKEKINDIKQPNNFEKLLEVYKELIYREEMKG